MTIIPGLSIKPQGGREKAAREKRAWDGTVAGLSHRDPSCELEEWAGNCALGSVMCCWPPRAGHSVTGRHSMVGEQQNSEMTAAGGLCLQTWPHAASFCAAGSSETSSAGSLVFLHPFISRMLPASAFVCSARQIKKTPNVLPPESCQKTENRS